jgi:hypothetical protein
MRRGRYESVRLAGRPVGLGIDVTGAGERLGFFGHSLRLINAAQRVERLSERAGDVAQVSLTRRTEHLARLAQTALGRRRVSGDQLNLTSRDPTKRPIDPR